MRALSQFRPCTMEKFSLFGSEVGQYLHFHTASKVRFVMKGKQVESSLRPPRSQHRHVYLYQQSLFKRISPSSVVHLMHIALLSLQIHLTRLRDRQERNPFPLKQIQLRLRLRSSLVDTIDLDPMTRRRDMQIPVPGFQRQSVYTMVLSQR